MNRPSQNIRYALLDTPEEVERAYAELTDAGIVLEDISLLMSETTHAKGFEALARSPGARGLAAGTVIGGTLGGILGGLAVLGSALNGGIGLMVVGPLVAFAAAGGLLGGLIGFGVPADEARQLHRAVQEGKALIVVRARDREGRERAERILRGFSTSAPAARPSEARGSS